MSNFNKVLLMGRLTKDPELRYTPQGIPVSDLRLAVSREYNVNGEQRKDRLFIDATVWRRQAEVSCQYLRKGSPIFVEGRLAMDEWDRPDGQRVTRYRVVVENFRFIGPAAGGGGGGSGGRRYESDGFGDDVEGSAGGTGVSEESYGEGSEREYGGSYRHSSPPGPGPLGGDELADRAAASRAAPESATRDSVGSSSLAADVEEDDIPF